MKKYRFLNKKQVEEYRFKFVRSLRLDEKKYCFINVTYCLLKDVLYEEGY